MPDLLDEIKEDLKEENLIRLWNKYGNHIIGAAVGLVIATAGVTGWKSYQKSQNEKMGDKLYTAFELDHRADFDGSIKAYETLEQDNKAFYSGIAEFRKAGVLFEKGKKEEANLIYKKISDDKKAPKEIRDLAEIYFIYNSVDFSNPDNALMEKVQKISGDKSAVFASSAKELLAYMQYGKKDYAAAEKTFDELTKGLETPPSMRTRSEEMLNIVKTKAVK